MRCAPQSAEISDAGTPQTFSLYALKKCRYSRQPKRAAMKPSSVSLVLRRADAHPEIRRDAPHRFDRAEVAQHVHRDERVVVELALVEDAALARPAQEVLRAEDLPPEVVDRAAPW